MDVGLEAVGVSLILVEGGGLCGDGETTALPHTESASWSSLRRWEFLVVAVEGGGGAADINRVVDRENKVHGNVHDDLSISLDRHHRTAGALPDTRIQRAAACERAGLELHQLDPGLV